MTRIYDSVDKYKLMMVLLVVFFVLFIVLAIFFSNVKFEKKPEGTVATVLNDGDLIINYVDGENVSFNDSKEHSYSISITNSGNSKLYYSIYFSKVNTENVNVKVKNEDGDTLKEIDKDISGTKLVNLYSIEASETVRYTIVLESDKKVKFEGTLKVVNESLSTETFADLILLNNNVSVPQSRIGSEIAVLNEGLITTLDNKGNAYYFRGSVDNNYVKLGAFLFRIVRINGDGTVRLVLNNVIETQVAYNTNLVVAPEDPSNLSVLTNATILTTLNTWLETNFKNISPYIANGDFCTDANFSNDINGIKYSSMYERIFNDEAPDLYCGGVVHTGKIGLLSVDEIVLAGASGNKPNTSYYLYNKEITGNYLTNSSYFINPSNNVVMVNIMSNGAIGDGIVANLAANVRPVINIGVGAKVKGEGTIDNPYIIVS